MYFYLYNINILLRVTPERHLGSTTEHQSDTRAHRVERLELIMIDDQDLGFFANFLGVFIFVLVIAYHFVMADPKFEGN
ncbi:hypothetical protein VNO78_17550 [Psophocarpus tetragonolobus]|uniref:Dolichyl-diphosphooligosaccharide--protein glycosyltransferase subunit 4A n=1 Tax=Psophocarpus tetragonolobus TaxID=3891 RepID=A0AAN9SHY1_PSOTE